jgi:ankyrin repeat protein
VSRIAEKERPQLLRQNYNGRSMLHYAALLGFDTLAAYLLDMEDSFALAVDMNGLTPLHVAAEEGWAEVVNLLLQKVQNRSIDRSNASSYKWQAD